MKKQNLSYFALVIILIASQACSVAGTTPGSSGTTPSAIPEPSATATTLVPEPVVSGYFELLQEKMASGEWTREEGLVTLLKMFTREIKVSEAGLGMGVLEAEGTGIIHLATAYLRTGTDQTAKDEITRLLNLLVPSQEALDRYSIPVEQASSRAPGLAAPVRQAEEDCGLLWSRGFPDARTPVFPCFFFDDVTVAGNIYKVYYPLAWHGDASRDPFYLATLEAAQDSITLFQAYGSVFPIYFVFTTLADERDTADFSTFASTETRLFLPATATDPVEACPIIINPAALAEEIPVPGRPGYFKQTIAHEIFHCFQAWNLRAQFNGPGEDSWWWGEGTGEYFSNLVYPAVNAEQIDYAESFVELSKVEPLTNMSYENFAFFQFLGNRIGADGVIAMLRRMPTGPGRAAQLAALAAVPGMEETFEEFVRSLLDGTLMDSDGTRMAFEIDPIEEFLFADITNKDFTGHPFVFTRYWVDFESEKSFTVETRSDGVGRSAWRASGSIGGWGPLPATAAGGCEDLPYFLYVITTTPAAVRTEAVATTAVTEAPCDECLIGRWEATDESMLSFMEWGVTTGSDDDPTVESVSGTVFMEFEIYGTGAGGYENFKVHETGTGGNESAEVFVTFEGYSSGPFTADGSELIGLSGYTNILVTLQILVNGASIGTNTVPFRQEDFPVASALPTRYSCDGDNLTTWPPADGAEPIEWVHTRP